MANVFDFLKQKTSQHASKRSPDQLKKGVRYECFEFTQRKSDFIDKKTNEHLTTLVAKILDKESKLKYYVTMPSIYNNLSSEHVAELNYYINDKKPPFIVYYGKDGQRNDVLLHQHGEDIDQGKLQTYLNKESEEFLSKKRKLDFSSPSTSSD